MDATAIRAVVEGTASYDDLGDAEQAQVRAVWETEVAARLANLDLREEFGAAGDPWVVGDADGSAIECR